MKKIQRYLYIFIAVQVVLALHAKLLHSPNSAPYIGLAALGIIVLMVTHKHDE